MIVMPVSSDQDFAACGVRYSRAIGCPRVVLAAASMNPRTISSGVAPCSGGTGSLPPGAPGLLGGPLIATLGAPGPMPRGSRGLLGACVITTSGELVDTVEHPTSGAASTASPGTSRRLTA